MHELAWHLMFRTDDDRVLAPSPEARRALARTVYRVADGVGLLAFGAADTHLHLVVVCTRARAGRLAQQLTLALRAQLGIPVGFSRTRFREVRDQHHLRNVFHYVLGQRKHHGLNTDPFLDASSMPELLGARLLRTESVALARELLPREGGGGLLRHLGLAQLEPCTELVEPVDATAGALGLGSLDDHRALGLVGRAAVVELCGEELSNIELQALLERSANTICRLRHLEVPPELIRAAQLQMAMRKHLREEHASQLGAWRRAS